MSAVKKSIIKLTNHSLRPLVAILTIAVLIFMVYLGSLIYYQGRFFPGVKIAGNNIGGYSPSAASQSILSQFRQRSSTPLTISNNQQQYTVNLAATSPDLNLQPITERAFFVGRSGDILKDVTDQVTALTVGINFDVNVSFNNQPQLDQQLEAINQAVKKPPENAQVKIGDEVTITSSQPGQELDKKFFLTQIKDYLELSANKPVTLPLTTLEPDFSTEDALGYKTPLERVKTRPIKLVYESESKTIDQPTLYSLLRWSHKLPPVATLTTDNQIIQINKLSVGKHTIQEELTMIDPDRLALFLEDFSKKIDQPAQDAKFLVENTASSSGQPLKVREFQPAKEGRQVDIKKTSQLITQALAGEGSTEIILPVSITSPKVTNDSINNLGIKQLIGQGVSYFTGSITNRIYNLKLGASRLNGTLVAPGATFSFNEAVGDVSGKTGYKPAYIIKSGKTVLDDGGGICQVSTTVFRAALNTGLPITERYAHAYRVGYYEINFPPGMDATVFSPSVDFKFKNDTPGYILVQAYTNDTALFVDLYGTPDNREVTLTKPKILNQTPPLPEVRQDDPTLPVGTVKQVEYPAWGANVSFDRTVKKGSESMTESWKSNYRPWAAVFLVGTKTE